MCLQAGLYVGMCTCVQVYVCANDRGQRHQIPLELELQLFVSCLMLGIKLESSRAASALNQ